MLIAIASRIVGLGIALTLVFSASSFGFFGDSNPAASHVLLTMGIWTVITTATLAIAIRLARSGRQPMAWLTAIVGSFLALDMAAVLGGLGLAHALHVNVGTAPAWSPLALLDRGYVAFGAFYPDGFIQAGHASLQYAQAAHASTLLVGEISKSNEALALVGAFALAYAVRAARSAPIAATEASTARVVPVAMSIRAVALAIAFAGVGIWAWTTTAITQPNLGNVDGPNLPSGSLFIWAGLTATALVTCSFITLVAGRGPVAAPAVAIFVVLSATQCVTTRIGWHGLGTAAIVAAIGLGALAGAWWLTTKLAGPGTTTISTRRAFVAVAVAGALAAPTYISASSSTPTVINLLQYVVATLFWLIAITAAVAGRRSKLPRIAIVMLVVVPLATLLLFVSGTVVRELYWPSREFFIQAPLAVVALAVSRWDAQRPRMRSAGKWILLGLGTALLSVNFGNSLWLSAGLLGGPILRAQGLLTDGPVYTNVIGQLLVAIAMCLVASRWAVPPEAAVVLPKRIAPPQRRSDEAAVLA